MIRACAFLLSALVAAAAPKPRAKAEVVHFTAPDGCVIEALYQAPAAGALVFVNTHGLGSNRHEWAVLETALKPKGFGYLSLDLGGHGGSLACPGGKADYKTFTAADWTRRSGDITAAAAYLKSRKVPENRLILCGASIGANLSLKAAAEGLRPAGLALLSPGVSYAGIRSEDFLAGLDGTPVLLAASNDDPYAWESSNYLTVKAAARGLPAVFRQGPGGHGANMLSESRPELLNYILQWARKVRK